MSWIPPSTLNGRRAITRRVAIAPTDGPGGHGRSVVLLHAWGPNSGMWHPLVPRMQRAGLGPITIDRRGHGTSDRPHTGYDLDTLVTDIEGVIDHLGLADVAIVGHSLGAMEAAAVAARNTSGEIASFVLSATTTPCLTQSDTNSHGVPAAMFDASCDLMRADMTSWVTDNTAGHWRSTGIERRSVSVAELPREIAGARFPPR